MRTFMVRGWGKKKHTSRFRRVIGVEEVFVCEIDICITTKAIHSAGCSL